MSTTKPADPRIFIGAVWVRNVIEIEYLQPVEGGEEFYEKRKLPVDPDAISDDLAIKCNHLLFVGGESKGLDTQLWKDGTVTAVKVAMKKGAVQGVNVTMKHLKYGSVKSARIAIGGDGEIRIEEKTLAGIAKTALAIVDGVRFGADDDDDDDQKLAKLPAGGRITVAVGA